jgi:hypothetical protein
VYYCCACVCVCTRDGTVARTLRLQIDKLGGIISEPQATAATNTAALQRSGVAVLTLTPELSGSAESIGVVHRDSINAITAAGTSSCSYATAAASAQQQGAIHLTMSAARFGVRPGRAVSALKPAQDLVIVEVTRVTIAVCCCSTILAISTALHDLNCALHTLAGGRMIDNGSAVASTDLAHIKRVCFMRNR